MIVGGVAVVLHGHVRFTKDLDVVIELAPAETKRALEALIALGYKPRIPVSPADFANPDKRNEWIHDKGMVVLQMFNDETRLTVDVFVQYPLDFEELWKDSVEFEFKHTKAHVASMDHLIQIKRKAGRPQDLADVETLLELRRLS